MNRTLTRSDLVKEVNDAFRKNNRDIEITRRFQFQTPHNISGQCVFYLSLTQRPRKDRKGGYEMIYRLNGERISGLAASLILDAHPEVQAV